VRPLPCAPLASVSFCRMPYWRRGEEVKRVEPLFKLEGRLVCVLGGEERRFVGAEGRRRREYQRWGGTTPICFPMS